MCGEDKIIYLMSLIECWISESIPVSKLIVLAARNSSSQRVFYPHWPVWLIWTSYSIAFALNESTSWAVLWKLSPTWVPAGLMRQSQDPPSLSSSLSMMELAISPMLLWTEKPSMSDSFKYSIWRALIFHFSRTLISYAFIRCGKSKSVQVLRRLMAIKT